MLESMINPKRAEKGPIKMLPIGILYASLSILLVNWFFSGDPVLSEYSGILIVLFCVMFSLPFMYFIIKREERLDENVEGIFKVWKVHQRAIYALMWLFLGFVIAFSFWYILLGNSTLFNAQVGTYCMINNPGDIDGCVKDYNFNKIPQSISTGAASSNTQRFFSIVENNVYVMIFTLIFSLLFGAGAIFILAWNASVISAAIGIFTKHQIADIPLGLARYMIHGFPEIAAYFITALAGGIFGVGIIKNGIKGKKFRRIMENTFILIFIALIILIIAGLIEVYLTPRIF